MSHQEHTDNFGAKLGMWLFLFTELLLFGGLFILYAVYLARYPHEFSAAGRELNVTFGATNTIVLLTSSLMAAMAVTSIKRGERRTTLALLAGTLGCAGIFMVIKYLEWTAKFHHGIYPGSPKLVAGPPGESVFFGLYYITTGLHGVHVIIGGAILTWIGARVKSGSINQGDNVALENGTLYWHLVDLVWIFIFPLYYLIL
jgi:cytochrome c oxidase subunit III